MSAEVTQILLSGAIGLIAASWFGAVALRFRWPLPAVGAVVVWIAATVAAYFLSAEEGASLWLVCAAPVQSVFFLAALPATEPRWLNVLLTANVLATVGAAISHRVAL